MLAFVASHRILDGDEGFYMYASELVRQGNIPYKDFFYPQMPLLPYLYALWIKLFGASFYVGRSLSVVSSGMTGVLLFLIIRQRNICRSAAVLSTVLYVMTGLVWGWLPIVKTYAFSTMFLLAALYFFNRGSSKQSRRDMILAGLLLALSFEVRLYFIACLLPFLVITVKRRWPDKNLFAKDLLYAAIGVIIALLFVAYHIKLAPWPFLFDNLLYHNMRTPDGLIGALGQKVYILKLLMGLGAPDLDLDYTSSQFLVLAILAFIGFLKAKTKRDEISLFTACVLFLICFLPTPTFTQYFCVIVPLLLINGAATFELIETRLTGRKITYAIVITGILLTYMGIGLPEYKKYGLAKDNVIWRDLSFSIEDHRIETVSLIRSLIKKHTSKDDTVYVSWPAYLVGTDRKSVAGAENHFGVWIAESLNWKIQDNIKVISVDRMFVSKDLRPKAIVLGVYRGNMNEWLAKYGYKPVAYYGSTTIYVHSGNGDVY